MRSAQLRDRVAEIVKRLETEKEQLKRELSTVKRDEDFEVKKLQRHFSDQVALIESRQFSIDAELRLKKHDLTKLEERIVQENLQSASSVTDQAKRRRSRPR